MPLTGTETTLSDGGFVLLPHLCSSSLLADPTDRGPTSLTAKIFWCVPMNLLDLH